jgi:tRNA-splicing ligase RtcB
MKAKELIELGIPRGKPLEEAIKIAKLVSPTKGRRLKKGELREVFRHIVDNPEIYVNSISYGNLAKTFIETKEACTRFESRKIPAPYNIWGENIDDGAIEQLVNACMLPVSVAGALMPDAHKGYGLPIGGVLATDNAVIPYAVGVDIACRMRMTVIDWPVANLSLKQHKLKEAIEKETRFGMGAKFDEPRRHAVMDEDWTFSKVVKSLKDKAWTQLGTSGSGNHFVEFGIVENGGQSYIALLSHSGSRGAGNAIATHFSKLAMEMHPGLPKQLKHLAWLDMTSAEGQEYWLAMELMGRYAAANHELIHKHIVKRLGVEVLHEIENHHNFAWKEHHYGKDVIVHRKGATPAAEGVYGVIPGSMATPGYVVRGRGKPESLNSASHGAGRKMSRTEAKKKFTWQDAKRILDKNGVVLMSAGLDEVPMAYKDIDEVMAHQADLVEVTSKFMPKLVKMAPAGERPED